MQRWMEFSVPSTFQSIPTSVALIHAWYPPLKSQYRKAKNRAISNFETIRGPECRSPVSREFSFSTRRTFSPFLFVQRSRLPEFWWHRFVAWFHQLPSLVREFFGSTKNNHLNHLWRYGVVPSSSSSPLSKKRKPLHPISSPTLDYSRWFFDPSPLHFPKLKTSEIENQIFKNNNAFLIFLWNSSSPSSLI